MRSARYVSPRESIVPLFASYVRHSGGWLVVLAATSLCITGAELLLPAALGRAVDGLLGPGDATEWLAWSLVLLSVVGVGDVLDALATGNGVARATARVRHRLIEHVLAVGPAATRSFGTGDLVARVVSNAADAGRAGVVVVGFVTTCALPAGSLVALVLIDPLLGAAFAVGVILVGLVFRTFATRLSDSITRYNQILGTIATRLSEALGGSRTIAAAGTVEKETRRVLEPLPALHRHGVDLWEMLATAAARSAVAAPLLQLVVIAVGGFGVAAGRLSPGELFAASRYAVLGAGVGGVTAVLGELARVSAGIRRSRDVLSAPAICYGPRDLPNGPGTLEFRDVRVLADEGAADEGALLDSVSLVVPGGAAAAVVGPSGAGKSILSALACRLLDPDAGEVLLDGVPLRELSHDTLHREVGAAFHRPALVGKTVADAIMLGQQEPTGAARELAGAAELAGEAMRRAARAVCADGFIERLPTGYDTALTDAPMSGGEVQRLGLARAWHGARLLVLDDATSSLDTATEMQIARVLTEDRGRRTRLIVAHRAATAARADLVVWLEAGSVRAVGPHQVLWEDPRYRAVFQVDPATGADTFATAHSR